MNQKEKEQSGKFHLMQRKWFIIVVIASRIAIMQKAVTVILDIFNNIGV